MHHGFVDGLDDIAGGLFFAIAADFAHQHDRLGLVVLI
jgi:hypothetical protein